MRVSALSQWILSVPNATPEELGMPIGSQRSKAIAGEVWLLNRASYSCS